MDSIFHRFVRTGCEFQGGLCAESMVRLRSGVVADAGSVSPIFSRFVKAIIN